MKRIICFCLNLILFFSLQAQEKTIEGISKPGEINIVYKTPTLRLGASFIDANGNNALDAEEKGSLKVSLRNDGPGKGFDVILKVNKILGSQQVILPQSVKAVPLIKPGESQVIDFPIEAGFNLEDGILKLRVEATEKFNNPPTPLEISLETRAFIPPELIVADVGINDDQGEYAYGNGNRRIEKGETIEVRALVQNTGQGEAEKVSASIAVDPNLFYIGKKEFMLGDLAPGEFREISFALTVPPNYTGAENLDVKLKISESRNRYGKNYPINLILNKTEKRFSDVSAQQITITGKKRTITAIDVPPSLNVDIEMNIPISVLEKPDAVAVIIGNRDYLVKDVPSVEFAHRDAATVKEYLIQSMGYREDNIIYMINATKAQLDATFGTESDYRGKLFNYVKAGKSEVFIYYSGHGAPDPVTKQAYLVPVDADPAFVNLNGYSLNTFYKNLGKIPAKFSFVVLDACFSGSSEGGMLLKNASPIFIDVSNPALLANNSVIFSSSRGDQISSWYPEKNHGLFTYFFLKGIQGEADKNRDRTITISELKDFVSENVPWVARRLHNREQTPEVLNMIKKEDLVITKYK